jgi:NodT family efflux transporter outer membrane factor (OMF) lipoprotein
MQRNTPIALSILALSVILAGCSSSKKAIYDVPVVSLPTKPISPEVNRALTQANSKHKSPTADAPPARKSSLPPLNVMLGHWWQFSNNAELTELMDRGLAHNRELRSASLRIMQAQTRYQRATANESPVITAPISSGWQAPYSGVGRVPQGGEVKAFSLNQLSLQLTWRPDIWGELDALQTSAQQQLLRSVFQRDDIQRLFVAQLANDYIEYLTLNDRIRVAKETEQSLQRALTSVSARFGRGDATITELEQQRTAVYSISATIPNLEQQRQATVYRIAELVGAQPETLTLSQQGIDSFQLSTEIPDIPSQTLLRRPDVRAVEAQLIAANADIEAARAKLLPSLNLSAQVGYGSQYFSRLLDPSSLFWNTLASVTTTIFDGGQKASDVAFSQTIKEEMIETYLKVIYNAVKELDTAVSGVVQVDKTLNYQEMATESARKAHQYSQESYRAGAVDFLTLLDTQRVYHKHLDDRYRFQMDKYKSMIALYASLGGGLTDQTPLPVHQFGVLQGISRPNNLVATDLAQRVIRQQKDVWYAELLGTYSENSMEAAVRDFNRTYPAGAQKRHFLPILQGRVQDPSGEYRAWYRLFVRPFEQQAQANRFCTDVSKTLRCQVISADELIKISEQAVSAKQHDPIEVSKEAGKVNKE